MNRPAHKTERVNRTKNVWFYPFTFTGNDPRKGWRIPLDEIKYNEQRDEETGFGYFGARYMDHELMTMWLSVDPLADKYPSISPYAYCAWNPVKLVDPDGRKIWIESGDGTKVEYQANMDPSGDDASRQQIQSLNQMYSTDLGEKLLGVLIESNNDYYITNESSTRPNTCATVKDGNGARLKMGGKNDALNLSHELFHAYQYECGQGGATYKNEVEAYLFSISLNTTISGYGSNPLRSRNPNTTDGRRYEEATYNLQWNNSFSLKDFETAVQLFQSQSMANADGTYNASHYSIGDAKSTPLLLTFYPLIR